MNKKKQQKRTTTVMMEGFSLENLFEQVLENSDYRTGQIPLDAVLSVLLKSTTHSAIVVAKSLNVNTAHLRGAIALLTGTSLSDMILAWRLLQAKHLLLTTEQSVASVARQCGYRNSISLILASEKAFGKTPVEIRKGVGGRRWKQNSL